VPTFAEAGFPGLKTHLGGIFFPFRDSFRCRPQAHESGHRARSADLLERLEANGFDPVGGSLDQTPK